MNLKSTFKKLFPLKVEEKKEYENSSKDDFYKIYNESRQNIKSSVASRITNIISHPRFGTPSAFRLSIYTDCLIISDRKRSSYLNDITTIVCDEDDYYYVEHDDVKFYKCDQDYGLIQLIKDLFN